MIGKLRRLLDHLLRVTRENPRLSMAHPAVDALDTFLFGKGDVTAGAPHVREYMDLKRFASSFHDGLKAISAIRTPFGRRMPLTSVPSG